MEKDIYALGAFGSERICQTLIDWHRAGISWQDMVVAVCEQNTLNEQGSAANMIADYTISISAEEDFLRARLIDRRIKTSVDPEASTQFVDFSDMPNVRLCLQKTAAADLELRIDAAGDYHIVSGGLDESY